MRYIIIGAGAVGGTVGGLLHENGSEVVLVARGAHHDALRTHGLRLTTPEGARTLRIPVVAGPADLEPCPDDVLIVAVKIQDAAAALDAWAGRWREHPVVCAQNGVEGERLALRRFADVYGMCVWLPSTHLEPGRVTAPCAPYTGFLHLGRYPSGADETARLISADLEKGPFRAPVTEDVMRWKYAKLLDNLANAVEALSGPIEAEAARQVCAWGREEGRAVFAAAGIDAVGEEEQGTARGGLMQVQPIEGERHGGSSWQSLARGTGSIEADYLNGEVVLLGRRFGVPTPVNALLQEYAATAVREGHAPGALKGDDLYARAVAARAE